MTPNARCAAAIDILEAILSGGTGDRVLANWGRGNRYAGSKDRAAIRDIVFECLRRKQSFMHSTGLNSARGLVMGYLLACDAELSSVFTGEKFAPAALMDDEQQALKTDKSAPNDATRLDYPSWLEARLQTSLGDRLEANMTALQNRAAVYLRVNSQKTTRDRALASLAADQIRAVAVTDVETALQVTQNPRRVAQSKAYLTGLVELQDAGSQSLALDVPLKAGARVLDYCAGGGGKSLALAARGVQGASFFAYDAAQKRMGDLPARADRAGTSIEVLTQDPVGGDADFDCVILDVPCSGTGAWRRNPEGKWRLTETDLADVIATQQQILTRASQLVSDGGQLIYMTCSVLRDENQDQITQFLDQNSGWVMHSERNLEPLDNMDGFFVAVLSRE